MKASVFTSTLVVGTGFGGAVVACRLSQAGFAPLVLERGRRYEASDFPALPSDNGFLPDGRRLGWGPEQGFVDAQDLEEIVSVQAAGYGGGSLMYANVHLRARPELFAQVIERDGKRQRAWPADYTRQSLDPYYDLVASMLDVAPITEHAEGAELVKTDQLKRVARALGRESEFFHPPLAVSRKSGMNQHGREQKACVQCGACCMGCPHRAKNTLDFNYLAVAEAHGAVVKTQCEVTEIERQGGRYLVSYTDHLRAEQVVIEAEFVFLCAGALHTTRLLGSAKLSLDPVQQARSRVGLGYFPNADAFGVVFDTEHPQYPSWGPTITTATVFRDRVIGDRSRTPERSWFMLQDGGYSKELERMIGLLRSPLLAGRNLFPKPQASDLGAGRLGASEHEPRRPRKSEAKAPALRSPFDAVLDAWAGGAFGAALPAQLETALPAIREALSQVLMPAIIDDTIERGLLRRFRRVFRWLPPESPLGRTVLRALKSIAGLLGSSEEIARDVQVSLERLGGLSREEAARRLLGYDDTAAERRLMLLAMGPDMTPGVLHVANGKVRADLDLYHLAPRYLDEELAMRDVARALGGELRVNPAWSFLGKPVTVHGQGGCRLGDSEDLGVTDPDGQVWHAPGLYVIDGASLCSSVGSNPSATIAAIAERNVLMFIRSHGKPDWPKRDETAGAKLYRKQVEDAASWARNARARGFQLDPPLAPSKDYVSKPLGIAFEEHMQGFLAHLADASDAVRHAVAKRDDATFRRLETLGRPEKSLELVLTPRIENLARFLEDLEHTLEIKGQVGVCLPGDARFRWFDAVGTLKLFQERSKSGMVLDEARAEAQARIAGSYTSSRRSSPDPEQRTMEYDLAFEDRGVAWRVAGYKRIRKDPGLDAWRDTTALFVRLEADGITRSAGVVHLDLSAFVKLLRSMRVVSDETAAMVDADPARVAWTIATFVHFFFGNLQRIYLPEAGVAFDTLFRAPRRGGSR